MFNGDPLFVKNHCPCIKFLNFNETVAHILEFLGCPYCSKTAARHLHANWGPSADSQKYSPVTTKCIISTYQNEKMRIAGVYIIYCALCNLRHLNLSSMKLRLLVVINEKMQ